MNERTGIGELKGIGEKTEKLFHRLGVYTVGDLLRHYPRGYDIYEAPVPIDDLTEGRNPDSIRFIIRSCSGITRIAKCRLQL